MEHEPLDPTTARVVNGLAERLLPALTRALASELEGPVLDALRKGPMAQMYEALIHVEEALRQEVKGSSSGRQDLLREGRSHHQELLQGLQALLGELSSLQEALQASIRTAAQGLEERMRRADGAEEISGALKELQAAIPGWEGALKAHVQAQSRELDEMSQELGDLQRQSETALIQALREAARQEVAERDMEWERRIEALRSEAGRRFRRAVWLLAGIGGLSLLFALAGLVR